MTRALLLQVQTVAALAATVLFLLNGASSIRAADPVVIEIRGFAYLPENPKINPGDVVIWINRDIVPHTVTAEDGNWDSGSIEAGGEWRMTVGQDTTGSYFCRFHPSMTGSLAIGAG
jgi:plastocyanin